MADRRRITERPEEMWVMKAMDHTYELAQASGPDCDHLFRHLPEVEKWAKKLLKMEPEANETVVMLAVWLHDVGKAAGDKDADHAVNSEAEARRFLDEIGVPKMIAEKVAHCARAHRCKDVQPTTLEARLTAAADSASHFTDIVYADMARRGDVEGAKAKLERDIRDAGLIPMLQEDLQPIYKAWKQLLEVYPE